MEKLKAKRAWIAFGIAAAVLVAGVWGPGLWDPWEMNRSFVARRMAEAPKILVAEPRPRTDPESIAQALASALAEDATILSTADSGSVTTPIELCRTQLADRVVGVAVIDVDGRTKTSADPEGLKSLTEMLRASVPLNASTDFLLVSGSGASNPNELLASVIQAARAAGGEDADEIGDEIGRQVFPVSGKDGLVEAVRQHLGGDAFLAQFKSAGRTAFAPPLDPFLVSLSFRVFGLSEFSARLPGVVLAILVLLTVGVFARRTFGEGPALLSLIVLATCPLFAMSSRFVANEMSTLLFLALGVVAFVALVRSDILCPKWLGVLIGSVVLLWLSGGMTAVVMLAILAGAWPLIRWEFRRVDGIVAGAVLGVAGLLALLTFVPDGAFFRQFRFTAATFAGGMRSDAESFDFAIKEVGFGLFPWSALLPFSVMAVVGRGRDARPERIALLLWAVVPFLVLMVTLRPMNHYLYAGVPALAVLTAVFLDELEDDALQSRLLAFVGFGLFLVMAKDLLQSPAPLVSYLTTDPMFAEPGKGEIVFPSGVALPLPGKAAVALAGAALLVGGGRLVSLASRLPATFAKGRTFWIVLAVLCLGAVLDIVVFLALKWETVSGRADPDADVAAVLLRIFLTGPDILVLYLLIASTLLVRKAASIRSLLERGIGPERLVRIGRALLVLEQPRATTVIVGASAVLLLGAILYQLQPELSYHLSQKHILDTYRASAERMPGELFRHGVFAGRGSEDSNFYTGQVRELTSRAELVERLRDATKRTFFIVPKNQWSEIDSTFRSNAGGKRPPVLDDRSSRFILVASSLAPGEEDRNWLADATLTESQFKALPDVERETVSFDDKIQLVGYSLDSKAVRRGGQVTLKMYFKVLDKVPASYRIFMHIDRVGSSSRIHGDHWILNLVKETEEQTSCVGCYATNHWLKDDIIVDSYVIDVPIGSPSGPHDIWMGFYSPGDDRRMPVKSFDKDKIRHDGQNRVRIGVLTVE